MNSQNKKTYPDCPIITRIVEVGGLSKTELIQKLKQNSILMNEYGEKLLTDERFTTSPIKHRSITIASEILTEDDDFPKGFYLRKIDGMLWLRGYLADQLHVWNPDNHFIFCHNK